MSKTDETSINLKIQAENKETLSYYGEKLEEHYKYVIKQKDEELIREKEKLNNELKELKDLLAFVEGQGTSHYRELSRLQLGLIEKFGTLNLDKIKVHKTDASEPIEIQLMSLRGQFQNQDKYVEVINKLVENGNLRKSNDGKLDFIRCHIAGTKYGVEALRQVLDNMSLLKKQSGLTNNQILEIHKNTFKDFDADIRTLNNKNGISKAFTYFKEVLS